MPQLLILAAIGAGTYVGTRWLRKKVAQFAADLGEEPRRKGPQKTSHTAREKFTATEAEELVIDPKTGIYHIKKD